MYFLTVAHSVSVIVHNYEIEDDEDYEVLSGNLNAFLKAKLCLFFDKFCKNY